MGRSGGGLRPDVQCVNLLYFFHLNITLTSHQDHSVLNLIT